MVSIHSPAVRAEAQKYGITDLQAYRKLNALEYIRAQEAQQRTNRIIEALQLDRTR